MRRSELPYLDDLRAFETTARTGSVRAAADEMSLTHAAVSRRVSRLADVVGAPLFARSGRGIALTTAGEALRDACRRSFDDIGRTIASIREMEGLGSGPILLSCERSVAMRWLIPRLGDFEAQHPDIIVHLSVGGGAVDLRGDGEVIALRRLDFPMDPSWTARTLFAETVGPVMVPDMRDRFEAGDYVALVSKTRPEAWDDWLAAHPHAPHPRDRRVMDHHFLMVEAACAGLGVGLAPKVVASDDVDRGRLVAPWGFEADGSHYGLVVRCDTTPSTDATTLTEWIEVTCGELLSV
ncbi:MAG: LysR family transcriptional regulator [Pseudomonadota bacterium]